MMADRLSLQKCQCQPHDLPNQQYTSLKHQQ
jgi:hypothetical protein